MRTASPTTATIVSLVTALALVLALLAAPPPAANATTSTASPRPTVVDPALASELLSSGGTPLGTRATAIVSAHGPSGLAAIEAAG
ncbi:MAG: hypothetical protein KGZ72_06495, partial [Roseovarius sp.]|nr:hypothetical protein [Roseovarius sp.]